MAHHGADPRFAAFTECFPWSQTGKPLSPLHLSVLSSLGFVAPSASNNAPITSADAQSFPANVLQPAASQAGDLTSENTQANERRYVDQWKNMEDLADRNLRTFRSWLDGISHQIPVDVDRLIRFFLLRHNTAIVDYLIDHAGASLTSRDIQGRTVIFYAIASRECSMLEYVASKIGSKALEEELNRTDLDGATPMHYATDVGSVKMVQFCLTHGADPHIGTQPLGDVWSSNGQNNDFLLVIFAQLEEWSNLPIVLISCESNDLVESDHCVSARKLGSVLPNMESLCGNSKSENIWIHVPWTNAFILHAALRASSFADGHFHDQSSEFLLHSLRDPPTVPGNPFLNYRAPVYEANPKDRSMKAITFPCLMLEEMHTFKDARNFHIRWRKLIQRSDANRFLQAERSLDEAYYPSLGQDELDTRNKEQVVSRECKNLINGVRVTGTTKPILVVPQLWIWIFGNHIFSAYSGPGSNVQWVERSNSEREGFMKSRGFTKVRDEVYTLQKTTQDGLGTGIRQTLWSTTAQDHAAEILAEQIENFGKPQADNKYQSPLDIFEMGVVRILSELSKYMGSQKRSELTIKFESKFMDHISDIRNELAMIDEILRQQDNVLEDFIKDLETDQEVETLKTLNISRSRLQAYRARVIKIDKDAERVDKSLQDQLNLKRAYASIDDANASMKDAHISLFLGTAVIGFTFITIVFAPLAFMTALFALPIDLMAKNKDKPGGDGIYKSRYIVWTFIIAELATLAITGIAVILSLRLLPRLKDEERKSMAKKSGSNTPGVGINAEEDDEDEKQNDAEKKEIDAKPTNSFFPRVIRRRTKHAGETTV